MKKLLSLILVICLIISAFTVTAAEKTAEETYTPPADYARNTYLCQRILK